MKNYFNLTVEESIALVNKHDFTPANFAKPITEETTTNTTTNGN